MLKKPIAESDDAYVVVTDYIDANTEKDLSGAIQELINKNPNRTIYFPDGVYLISKPIFISGKASDTVSLELSDGAVIKAAKTWKSSTVTVNRSGNSYTEEVTTNSLITIGEGFQSNNNVKVKGSYFGLKGGILDGDGRADGVLYSGGRESLIRNLCIKNVTIGNSVTSIGSFAFQGCLGLTSATIGNSVKRIEKYAFANCCELLDVYCYAEDVPSANVNTFEGSNIKNSNLHVPAAAIDSYKAKAPWKNFGNITDLYIENPEAEKCATPVVTYAEGKLSLSCQTEGTEFVTKIASEDINTFNSAEIELTATYNVEVYAFKDGMNNSDTVNVALVWVENGKVGEESGVISVESAPVLIQANGGNLTINGVAKGCEIVVYTLNGTEVAKATATEGSTTINTGLQSGTVAIVKLGNKSVKIKI